MNNRGNIMINLMFFFMALVVLVSFVGPIRSITDMAQQSDNLNCRGYVYNGNSNHTLSFNSTMNNGASGSPTSCMAIRLYLPYIFLAFLIAGVVRILYDRTLLSLGGEGQDQGGGY